MLDKETGLLLDWKGSSLSVFLSVCLQELCPQDVLKAVVVTDTDQSALKTAIQNSHPVVAYDVEQSADCYGTIRGLVVYKKECAPL